MLSSDPYPKYFYPATGIPNPSSQVVLVEVDAGRRTPGVAAVITNK